MKSLGNEIYIQRGEIWSLDFDVATKKDVPFTVFKEWKNPFLVITVASARYNQKGDFRKSWWLDLNNRWVEQEDGNLQFSPMKRFISNEVLEIEEFGISVVLDEYTKFTADGNKDNRYDVSNYLFVKNDKGKKIYKYCDYEIENGIIDKEIWYEYDFRIIKQFETKDWIEQSYLFDVKIIEGESIEQFVNRHMAGAIWDRDNIAYYLEQIGNKEVLQLFEEGIPLASKNTVAVLLEPTKLNVGTNIMGGK